MSPLMLASVAGLVWVGFHEEAWFRRVLGLREFSREETLLNGAVSPNEAVAGLAARMGGARAPTVTIDRSIHRTTWGVRLLSLALSGAATWFLLHPQGSAGGMTTVGDTIPGGVIGGALILASIVYAAIFTWAFRIEVDRDTLSVMGPAFAMRDYPLSGLERIEEDGPYAWRMRFADGRRPHVMKTVVGSAGLRQRLADVLEANARG